MQKKIHKNFESFENILNQWKADNETIVFTNGCFDIVHHGHIASLQKSAELGTKLVVGLNSDESMTLLKGTNRPIIEEDGRAIILAAFGFVDAVVIFEEETPTELIKKVAPDILTKGAQYTMDEVVGHEIVLSYGGKVELIDLVPGISTSEIIKRIKTNY